MGTTSTPNYGLIKPNIYEEFDTWGSHVNNNSDTLDGIIKGNENAAAAAQAAADAAQATADGKADLVHTHVWADITDPPASFPPSAHNHTISEVTGLQGALDAKAGLDSPAFVGNPTYGGSTLASQEYVLGEVHKAHKWIGDADYTLTASDLGRSLMFGGPLTGTRTLTLPDDLAIWPGLRFNVGIWDGDGSVQIVPQANSNATMISKDSKNILTGAGAGVTIEKMLSDGTLQMYWVVGDLS